MRARSKREQEGGGASGCHSLTPSAIIGDGDRKSWDPRAPMIWDNFFLFFEQIAPSRSHISALIHVHVVGSRVDVVILGDQIVRVARFSCGFFTAMAGNKNQGSSMYFYALN